MVAVEVALCVYCGGQLFIDFAERPGPTRPSPLVAAHVGCHVAAHGPVNPHQGGDYGRLRP